MAKRTVTIWTCDICQDTHEIGTKDKLSARKTHYYDAQGKYVYGFKTVQTKAEEPKGWIIFTLLGTTRLICLECQTKTLDFWNAGCVASDPVKRRKFNLEETNE